MRKPVLLLLWILCGLAQQTRAQFTRGNIVVLQVGSGTSTTLTSASAPLLVREFTTTGTAGLTVKLDSTGSTALTTSGSATSEGYINRSTDGKLVVIPGYNAPRATTGIASTTSAAWSRSFGTVNAAGTYILAARMNNMYNSNNIRGAISDGAGSFWASGAVSGGIAYATTGATTGTLILAAGNSPRTIGAFGGNLYYATTTAISQVGTGLPTSTGQTATVLSGLTSTSIYSFAINDQGTIAYLADDGAGIRKYTFNGTSWSFAYTVASTNVRGLLVDFSTANPVIYATTITTLNSIIKVQDNGSAGAPYTPTTLITSATNTVFRGLCFAPSGVINLNNFSGVGALTGTAGAAGTPGSFSVNGTNLTNDITVTAPTNFEVSTSSGSGYGSSVTLAQSGGSVAATTLYIRTAAAASSGAQGGQVTLASTGATGNSLRVDGTVTVPTPVLTLSNQTGLTGQSATQGAPGATPGSFQINGANLTVNATVSAPANFEVSTDNVTYSNSLTLPQSGGSLSGQPVTVYVRIKSTAPTGSVSGNVTVASTGATTQSVAVSGTVTATATLVVSNENGLSVLNTTQGTPSAPGSFQVSGTGLTNNVTIIPSSTDFEIATSAGGPYSSGLTLTQSGGTLPGQPVTIYVRITSSAVTGNVAGTIDVASVGAAPVSETVSGTVTGPTLTTGNANGLAALTSIQGAAGTTPGTFEVSGTNLTGTVSITPSSASFEVSTAAGGTYSSSLTLTPSGGTLPGQPITVYVRLSATAPAGSVNGTVNITTTGAAAVSVNVSGTVAAPSLVASPISLSGFSTSTTAASPSQSFTLTGANLTANTSVSVTSGFELSLNDTTYTATALSLLPTSNSLSKVIYVRAAAGSTLGSLNGTVTATSGTATATVTLNGQITQPFAAGNLVVARVGDGIANLANTGNAVFLDEYTPAGVLVQSISLPTTVSGSNRRLVQSGTATSEGALTRSADGQYLTLAGYDAPPSSGSSLTGSTSTSVNRTIGVIDYRGYVDVSTSLNNYSSGNNPRATFTTNGTDLWAVGASGGVYYAAKGTVGPATLVSTTITNIRTLNYAEYGKDTGQLFVGLGSGSMTRVARVGLGTPTNTGNTITNLSGISTSASVYQFFFADLNDTIAGVDVLYTALDPGGITKYSFNGTTWTNNGTIDAGTNSYRGLTGKVGADSTITLYAIRGFSTYADSGDLVTMTDRSGWNAAPSNPVVTSLMTKNLGSKIRLSGVAFAPVNNSATGNSKLWTGNASARYGFAGNWSGFSKPTDSNNVVIQQNKSFYQPRLLGDTQTLNNLTIQANAALTLVNGGTLTVRGTVTNNGSFNATEGTVDFQGTGAQTIPALTARNLTFNGAGFTLSGNVTATNSLTFTSGIVNLGFNNLTVAQGATLSGGSAASYARTNSSGRLKAFVNATPVVFPVGVSSYNPATIANDGAGATETGFSIRVIESVLQEGTSGAAVTKPVVNRTWMIDEDGSGTANASLTLQWNNGETVNGFSPAHVYIAHYNTIFGKWEPLVDSPMRAPAASGGDPYTATATGITSFSPFTVGGGGNAGPLPVRISPLAALKEDTHNLLLWDSYEEEPGLHYRAEYAADGKTFSPISEITAAGTPQHYRVTHQPQEADVAYYRIVVVEGNGTVSYSNVAMVKSGSGTEGKSGSVYPNPATDYLQIQVPGALSADATLSVMDASGRVVIDEPLKSKPAVVDLHRLPVGIYQLRVMNGGQVELYRIVKQ